MSDLKSRREQFNDQNARELACQVGVAQRWKGKGSSRFAYFNDERTFVVVAGGQEAEKVDLALAYGLTYRDNRQLVLVLPKERAFPTLQRAAWLKPEAQPRVYTHDGTTTTVAEIPARGATIDLVVAQAGGDPLGEFAAASTPAHLGEASEDVAELVEWATRHPRLDAAHRRDTRVWQCMGQRVLSLKGTKADVTVTAGIHFGGDKAPPPVVVPAGQPLDADALEAIRDDVEKAIAARLYGQGYEGRFHTPDEHWLQAVIRRDPTLVGIEPPALRELPAWRPAANEKRWGRGFIDLAGLDAHGDMRLVETKLGANPDDLLMLQGLDYYLWACAYEEVLRQRLGAPKGADLVLHYVIGSTPEGKLQLSHYAAAQAEALDIPWRIQTVSNWFAGPRSITSASSKLLPERQLPDAPSADAGRVAKPVRFAHDDDASPWAVATSREHSDWTVVRLDDEPVLEPLDRYHCIGGNWHLEGHDGWAVEGGGRWVLVDAAGAWIITYPGHRLPDAQQGIRRLGS